MLLHLNPKPFFKWRLEKYELSEESSAEYSIPDGGNGFKIMSLSVF